jgi:BASS family bile acid:Na+ symporter
MAAATLITSVLRASIAFLVFALGLNLSASEAVSLIRRPALFVRSVLSMNVVMPVIAVGLALLFNLHPAVKVALLMFSVSPVPPLLPIKQLRAGGGSSYVFSLLVIEAALAIVFAPISVELFEWVFGRQAHVSPATVALLVSLTVLAPLGAGIFVGRFAPLLARRLAKPVSLVAMITLVASLVPVLFVAAPSIVRLIGNGTLAALIAFVLAGMLAGHLLGGPEPENRTVLAFSTASRHPGVALAIATASFPEENLVLAAVLLYMIVNAAASLLYLMLLRSHPSWK